MKRLDLIIDALESVYTAEDMSVVMDALAAARELRELEPVAWWCGGSVSTRKGYFEEMGWEPLKPLYILEQSNG